MSEVATEWTRGYSSTRATHAPRAWTSTEWDWGLPNCQQALLRSSRYRRDREWFNDSNRFGFITGEDGEQDCFVHQSAIQGAGFRSLAEGERVEFDVVQGQKGPAAENVTKLAG
jgi:cold shock protein